MLRKGTVMAMVLLAGCAGLSPKFEIDLRHERVAYAVAGRGPVAVVFESGLGDGMDTWRPVFDSIASFATAFAYDRPGYGRSESVPGPRSGREVVRHLRALLARAGPPPPYVLVGHSVGGQYVELYARLHPEDVAGVVLVDARHPEFTRRCEARLGRGCAPRGLLKLLLPGHVKRELEGATATADQIRGAPGFPEVELRVLSRSTGKESEAWLALWWETQREYTKLSPRSAHIVSGKSGHYVHRDDPEAVIAAVRSVVERVAGASDDGPPGR